MNLQLPSEFKSYKPNITFNIDTPKFIVKIAETPEELLNVFHLRHNVFHKERRGVVLEPQISTDEFDIYADQLIVINKDNNQVVGTYRLISSLFNSNDQFCNWNLFDMGEFINKKTGNGIEMEWACLHKEVRISRTIHYLWLGLAKYFRQTNSNYMFGQVNVLNSNPEEMACIYNTLLDNQVVDTTLIVHPKKKHAVKSFNQLLLKEKSNQEKLEKLSRLFLWYLKLGARVHGHPVFSAEFDKYGFLLSLDFKNIANLKLLSHYEDAVQLKKNLST